MVEEAASQLGSFFAFCGYLIVLSEMGLYKMMVCLPVVREGGYEVDWSSDAGGQAVGFFRKVNVSLTVCEREAKCGRNVGQKGI